MEQDLYAQVVMIHQKDSENKKVNENTKKYNFHGQSTISRRWFDLDPEWLEETFMACELYFYQKLHKNSTRGDDTKTYQLFAVPIGNAKTTEEMHFRPAAPVLEYHQKSSKRCCFGSLASVFHIIGDNRAVPSILNFIEESLILQIDKFRNRIHFANYIMTNRMHIKGEQHLRYNLKVWHEKYTFDILNNISEYVTLVQLMELLGNLNHAISMVRVFDI